MNSVAFQNRKSKKPYVAVIVILVISVCLAVGLELIIGLAERSGNPKDYGDYVKKYAEEYNIPEYVIFAVIKVESDFDPKAKSSVGAMGLMQMMPSTFDWLTGKEHLGEYLPAEALYIPDVSIRYGAYYLTYLYRKFDHNWNTVFAAYNAGETNVSKWLKDKNYSDGNGNLIEIPFKETRNYVKKVNAAMDTYKELYYSNINLNTKKEGE